MTSRRLILLLTLGLLATWVACSRGVPAIRTTVEPSPQEGEALDEGRTEMVAAQPPNAALPGESERQLGLEALREGLAAAGAGDAYLAAAAFDRAATLLPAFAGWAHLLGAQAYSARGDTAEVRRRLAAIGPGPAAQRSWRIREAAAVAANDTAAAIRAAEESARVGASEAERAAAWARAGALRSGRGDSAAALGAFREAMRLAPRSQGGLAAARAAHDIGGLTADDRLLIGRTLLAHGGIDRGVPMLEGYLATSPSAAVAAEVRLEAGRTLFNARRYPAAETLLGAASRSPEAALLLARTRYRQGRQDAGQEGLVAVSRDHPATPAAAEALFLLGDLAHDAGRLVAAREYYRQAVATGVHNGAAADAAVRLAGISLQARDAPAAREEVERYLAARPRDALAAPVLYWLGRAHLALGEAVEAERRFRDVLDLDPFSYYGTRAAERLGTSLGALPLADPPGAGEATGRILEHAFFRIDLLRELQLTVEADFELATLQEAVAAEPAALYAVAEGMVARGQATAGALLGRRLQIERGVWDDRLLRIVYPLPYREQIVREARRNDLDPYVVAGLIRQESLFNAGAVSPAGAVGLMQVMPGTATGLARRAGIANFQPAMLRDPDTNVRLGTLFLADQMRRWNGRLSDVFAAYNAGPNRVVRWREYPEHGDDDIYVERIPIAETRDYVKRLRLNAQIYRRLYGD